MFSTFSEKSTMQMSALPADFDVDGQYLTIGTQRQYSNTAICRLNFNSKHAGTFFLFILDLTFPSLHG